VLVSVAPAAGAATFSNPATIEIPGGGSTASNAPASPYPSSINVTGLSGSITDVNVRLNNYSHQFSGDTHVVLVPPGSTGQNILLMSGAGGNAATPPPGVDITLDDASTTPLPTNTALQTGTYKPTARSTTGVFPAPGPGNNFCSPGIAAAGTPSYIGGNCTLATALNGSAANGEWKLYVIDIGAPDTGVIQGGWTLDITAGGPATVPQQLNVTKNGTGTGGTVRGLGISCPTACAKAYNSGTSVTLTATGDAFNAFTGFTGCDSTPTTTTCVVSMTAAKSVVATFTALPRTLSVGKVGTGSGTVRGTGINCGTDCEETYPMETTVPLVATPATGSRFAGWIGCPTPSANTCTVNATSNKNVTARFTRNPVYPLPNYPKPPGGGGGGGGSTGGKTFNGTPGKDTINGTAGNDVINCGAGDDVVNAGGGDDVINCGAGNDRVNGGAGNDRINGESGNDLLSGNEGNDRVNGGSGNERANGNEGNDRVGGGSGNDRVGGQSGRDTVNGDSGRDKVSGGSGNDRAGGQSGNDRVNGDSGNDRVNGGSGRDVLSGGAGNDSISARDRTRDTVNCGRGRDRVAADRRRGRDRVSRNCERVRRS